MDDYAYGNITLRYSDLHKNIEHSIWGEASRSLGGDKGLLNALKYFLRAQGFQVHELISITHSQMFGDIEHSSEDSTEEFIDYDNRPSDSPF